MLLTRREVTVVAQQIYKKEYGDYGDWSKVSVRHLYEKQVTDIANMIENQIKARNKDTPTQEPEIAADPAPLPPKTPRKRAAKTNTAEKVEPEKVA